jgi:hypothetical protein
MVEQIIAAVERREELIAAGTDSRTMLGALHGDAARILTGLGRNSEADRHRQLARQLQ